MSSRLSICASCYPLTFGSGCPQKNITPRFEFGFGLSYTSFHYTNLTISKLEDSCDVQSSDITNWESGKSTITIEGSSTALWYVEFQVQYIISHRWSIFRLHEPAYQVTFKVKNTGKAYGGEVCLIFAMLLQKAEPDSSDRSLNFMSTSLLPLESRRQYWKASLMLKYILVIQFSWPSPSRDMIYRSGTSLIKDGKNHQGPFS